ncbi:MAG: FkbM family methyltransferase [Daejeonella sp.]|uniref:FkbM family methyltransferase n=1 Tax=Daejeonella sp. TaxID=2805397 RepID=UPI003C7913DE
MNTLKKLKSSVKLFLQKTLGFNNYLYIFSLLAINRVKFEQEFHFFNDMIKDDGIILDIGANIGIMTTLMAQKSKNAKLIAFEPIPENIKALKRVVDHYKLKNVTIYEAALGEENGELKMVMPIIDNVKMQGLSHVLEEKSDQINEPGSVYVVPVYRLDGIKELNSGEKITAIKIDVENFEYHVLKGGEQILKDHMPIIYCELWDNEKKYQTIEFLRELGYIVKIFEKNRLVDYRNQSVTNFFFVPENAA